MKSKSCRKQSSPRNMRTLWGKPGRASFGSLRFKGLIWRAVVDLLVKRSRHLLREQSLYNPSWSHVSSQDILQSHMKTQISQFSLVKKKDLGLKTMHVTWKDKQGFTQRVGIKRRTSCHGYSISDCFVPNNVTLPPGPTSPLRTVHSPI